MIKGLYTAEAGTDILTAVADALANHTRGDMDKLRLCTILLPTRRAIRVLEETLLDAFQLPTILLPRLMAIGDIEIPDEDTEQGVPPPRGIRGIERLYDLIPFLEKHGMAGKRFESLWSMAQEIAGLIDLLQTENLDPEVLNTIAPDNLSQHWQDNTGFFIRVARDWLEHLQQEKRINNVADRTRRIRLLMETWHAKQPESPIWLVGSTGSIPAVRDLMRAVLKLDQGAVLLPGLDTYMNDADWASLTAAHPQAILRRTLDTLGYDRREVKIWPGNPPHSFIPERAKFLSTALSPYPCAHAPCDDDAITLVEAETPEEEIAAIAHICADIHHNDPHHRIVVIGNDPTLSEKLPPLLDMYGISWDSSAGLKISGTRIGLILNALMRCLHGKAGIPDLWSLLKNPAFYPRWPMDSRVPELQKIERELLRNALRSPTSIEELLAFLHADFVTDIKKSMASLTEPRPLAQWAAAWIDILPRFISTRALQDSECMNNVLRSLRDLQHVPHTRLVHAFDAFTILLDHLMNATCRMTPKGAIRVHILGTMEARLIQADTSILTGLNEGIWPDAPKPSPFLSRAMRHAVGLPDTERHAALSGHDFQQGFLSPRVIMTRARRDAEGPTLPARWLQRMKAIMPIPSWQSWENRGQSILSSLHLLHNPDQIVPCTPPQPHAVREDIRWPLSMSAIETWRADPFSFWAKYIAGLRPLDPFMPDLDAAAKGEVWHAVLKNFILDFNPHALPEVQYQSFMQAVHSTLEAYKVPEHRKRLWKARLAGAALSFIDDEIERRQNASPIALEQEWKGEVETYPLYARADRIDRTDSGELILYDYKTGTLPTKKDLNNGLKCQLSLLGLLMAEPVHKIAYLPLKGGRTESKPTEIEWSGELETQTREGFAAWVHMFLVQGTAFTCLADYGGEHEVKAADYLQLARYQEWGGQS